MVVQERSHPRGHVLGQDSACPLFEEAVDHHPVEAGQTPELKSGSLTQGLQVRRPLESRTRRLKLAEHRRGRHGRIEARLDLHDQVGAVHMGRHVQPANRAFDMAGIAGHGA